MFYLKDKGRKLPIEDNVYTVCPACGQEHKVDLVAVLTGGGDLYGTAVYCPRCAEKKKQAR